MDIDVSYQAVSGLKINYISLILKISFNFRI